MSDKLQTLPNAPAFPVNVHRGVTKRELFAAMAMQGMLSSSAPEFDHEALAQVAAACADTLIAELNKVSAET